jgi:hypothetical protein
VGKYVSTDWRVVVNNRDLSDHAFNVDTPQEKEQIDVSGFGGSREFLQGQEDATLTIQFLGDFGSSSVHATLSALYSSGTTFPIYVQPFNGTGTSDTNPLFGGTASLFTYNGGAATLNQRGEITAEFKPAPNSTFAWGTAAVGTV